MKRGFWISGSAARFACGFVAIGCACSSDNGAPSTPTPAPVAGDAGLVPSIGVNDPASSLQDPDANGRKRKPRSPRAIDIMLRSTPTGAGVYVGAEYVGVTPTMWSGEPASEPVEFVFVKPHYASARYKFIPITSGLVHGRLEALATPNGDAGLGPQIAPTFAPDASVPLPDAAPPAPPIDAAPPPPVDATAPAGSARGPTP